MRLRRARGEKRQQIKWIVYAGAVMFASFLAAPVVPGGTGLVADPLQPERVSRWLRPATAP